MYKGDISNDTPKRVLVNSEVLFIKTQTITKRFKFVKHVRENLTFDKFLLNKFYVYGVRNALTLELISFEYEDAKLEIIFNEIDRAGTNPFKYYTHYSSPKKLVADLPYRPEVVGVIDPQHQMMYGKWGLDF
jgi:hypothetical protein